MAENIRIVHRIAVHEIIDRKAGTVLELRDLISTFFFNAGDQLVNFPHFTLDDFLSRLLRSRVELKADDFEVRIFFPLTYYFHNVFRIETELVSGSHAEKNLALYRAAQHLKLRE